MTRTAISGARIFDGQSWHDGSALILKDGSVEAITGTDRIPSGTDVVAADDGLLVPGFVDLQVNGGGGVMLNDEPSPEGLRAICSAHARFGTTALLPTLITDSPATTAAVLTAGKKAVKEALPGFLGLHLEDRIFHSAARVLMIHP